ncbi:AMP-binding protein, partial [Thermobifida halotolerans]
MSGRTAEGVSDRLRAGAHAFPDRKAVVYPVGRDSSGRAVYRHVTYREMDEAADIRAGELRAAGIGAGTTTALMVRPGPELFAVAFGLIRIGAVPVIADPGLGLRRMLRCHRDAGAEAFVGVPAAHLVRLLLGRRAFAALRTRVTVGRRWLWGGPRLRDLAWGTGAATAGIPAEPVREPPLADGDLLAISFTTGSTGPAKGVRHPRGMVEGVTRQLEHVLGQRADDTSLVTVPLWGVLGLLVGSTCVLPPGDPSRVAAIRPEDVVDAIDRFGVTTMFASPALLDRLGAHAARTGRTLEGLRRVNVGGAPVREDIAASMCAALGPEGERRLTVVYGATEALPISAVDAAEARAG